ncbi:hypothetical protein N7523_010605 [Penicillium sp. IBT 18751x]|nr:hypothetical protein N7523_010605 [Penicillium sp. IBT 18751x]
MIWKGREFELTLIYFDTFKFSVTWSVSIRLLKPLSELTTLMRQVHLALINWIPNSTEDVVKRYCDIHVIGNPLADHVKFDGHWMQGVSAIQIAQGQQGIRALKLIEGHLGENHALTGSGGGGTYGDAWLVHDCILRSIRKVDQGPTKLDNHRFYVCHPDKTWNGAFERLIR